jgi:hypothetical protein
MLYWFYLFFAFTNANEKEEYVECENDHGGCFKERHGVLSLGYDVVTVVTFFACGSASWGSYPLFLLMIWPSSPKSAPLRS